MASEWIKMREDLADDLAVESVASACKMDAYAVVGRLLALWAWARRQTVDGFLPGCNHAIINRRVQAKKFSEALVACGWLAVEEGGMSIPKWDRHNSDGAKQRALTARRVEKLREKVTPPALQKTPICNADGVTTALPDKREIREEDRRRRLSCNSPNTPESAEVGRPTTPPAAAEPSMAAAAGEPTALPQPASADTSPNAAIVAALEDAGLSDPGTIQRLAQIPGITVALVKAQRAALRPGKGVGVLAKAIADEVPKAAKQAKRLAEARVAKEAKERDQAQRAKDEAAQAEHDRIETERQWKNLSREDRETLKQATAEMNPFCANYRHLDLAKATYPQKIAILNTKRLIEEGTTA